MMKPLNLKIAHSYDYAIFMSTQQYDIYRSYYSNSGLHVINATFWSHSRNLYDEIHQGFMRASK